MVEPNFYHTACGSGNLIRRRSNGYSNDPICGISDRGLVFSKGLRGCPYPHFATGKDVVIVDACRARPMKKKFHSMNRKAESHDDGKRS
jgi:hypothetical protein